MGYLKILSGPSLRDIEESGINSSSRWPLTILRFEPRSSRIRTKCFTAVLICSVAAKMEITDRNKENEVGWTCGTHKGGEICL
jgi:hypothetical protein